MRFNSELNNERVSCLRPDPNAYPKRVVISQKKEPVKIQGNTTKVLFPEPYENAQRYYNRDNFCPPQPPPPEPQPCPHNQQPMFDIKSLLPMLMSGKDIGSMLKNFMPMLGNLGGENLSTIFNLFKPKSKQKTVPCEAVDVSKSKFDKLDFIED